MPYDPTRSGTVAEPVFRRGLSDAFRMPFSDAQLETLSQRYRHSETKASQNIARLAQVAIETDRRCGLGGGLDGLSSDEAHRKRRRQPWQEEHIPAHVFDFAVLPLLLHLSLTLSLPPLFSRSLSECLTIVSGQLP